MLKSKHANNQKKRVKKTKTTAVLEQCGWTGDLQKYQNHVNKDCAFANVTCPHEMCSKELQRKDFEQHIKDCDYREIPCKYCGKRIISIDMDEHEENECAFGPVPCPNGCKVRIIRLNLTQHEHCCLLASVPCPFAWAGCRDKITRGDLESHIEKGQKGHMIMMGEKVVKQQQLNDAQSKEIATLKQKDVKHAEEIATLKQQMENMSKGTAQLSWIVNNINLFRGDYSSRPITIPVPNVGLCTVKLGLCRGLGEGGYIIMIHGQNLPADVSLAGTNVRFLKSDGSMLKESAVGPYPLQLTNARGVDVLRGRTGEPGFASMIGSSSVIIQADLVLKRNRIYGRIQV
jgi:DNA-directed RNA polymerase subunit RPC12/RpoP